MAAQAAIAAWFAVSTPIAAFAYAAWIIGARADRRRAIEQQAPAVDPPAQSCRAATQGCAPADFYGVSGRGGQ